MKSLTPLQQTSLWTWAQTLTFDSNWTLTWATPIIFTMNLCKITSTNKKVVSKLWFSDIRTDMMKELNVFDSVNIFLYDIPANRLYHNFDKKKPITEYFDFSDLPSKNSIYNNKKSRDAWMEGCTWWEKDTGFCGTETQIVIRRLKKYKKRSGTLYFFDHDPILDDFGSDP